MSEFKSIVSQKFETVFTEKVNITESVSKYLFLMAIEEKSTIEDVLNQIILKAIG